MNFNKIGLVALSTSAIFMATSCNKGDTKVTKEEFYQALAFEGVEYLQIKTTTKMVMPISDKEKLTENITTNQKMSPGVCYIVNVSKMNNEEVEYKESYATASDGTAEYIFRESRTGKFITNEPVPVEDCEYYKTPKDFDLTEQLEEEGIAYEDFKYKNDAYVISETVTEKGMSVALTINICFLNNKLTSLKMSMKSTEAMSMTTSAEAKFSYKQTIPADPSK